MTFDRGYGESDVVERLAGACGIVAGCSTLATAVLSRINKRFLPPPASIADIRPTQLTCPLCGRKQTLSPGRTNCPACNVIIELRIEEPHCAVCNYSLLMLKSDRCPECGAAVKAPAAVPKTEVPSLLSRNPGSS
jgi:rubrerythrin